MANYISLPFDGKHKTWETATGVGAIKDIREIMSSSDIDYTETPLDPDAFVTGSQYSDPYSAKADAQQQREAAAMQGAQIATGPQGEMRTGQQDLVNMLQARARGEGPSIAEMQLKQGMGRTIAGAQALAASQAGVNPALALRGTQAAATQANLQTSQQQAILRAQEMESARGQLGQQLGAVRGQDIGLATGQAGLEQGAAQANLQAEIQAQAQADAMSQFYEEQGRMRDQAAMEAQMEEERLKAEKDRARLAAETAQAESEAQAKGGIMAMAGSLLGGFSKSDVAAKKNIKRSPEKLDAFMNALAGYEYEYTDEAKKDNDGTADHGKILSVMAQDLERTPEGKDMVVENLGGSGMKGVNYGRSLGTMLAAIARLNERLGEVEGGE